MYENYCKVVLLQVKMLHINSNKKGVQLLG